MVQVYGTVITVVVILSTLLSIVEKLPARDLPVRGWFPYKDDDHAGFWFAWIHQNIGYAYNAILAIAFDTICIGTMIQIGGQIEILARRLYNMPDTILRKIQMENIITTIKCHEWEQKIIGEWVQHHLLILRLSYVENEIKKFHNVASV